MPQIVPFSDRAGPLRRRAGLAQAVRAFFDARGYLEVETPYLVPSPGEEVHLRPLHVPGAGLLHTSPEFAMKTLLAAGAGRIVQLARVWRDEQPGATHQREFTMLEWYRPGATLDDLMDETEALLRAVLPPVLQRPDRAVPLDRFDRLTLQQAFASHVGADLLAAGTNAAALAQAAGVALRPAEDWEALFFRLLADRVEPAIAPGPPTFLTHYPAAQAALARRAPDDPRVAERFELFIGGMELANAFIELTDAIEQRARFDTDRARRQALYPADPAMHWPLDEAFLAALDQGLPPCGGVALGFDRLAMLACGAQHIDQVQFLPPRPMDLQRGAARDLP